MLVHAANTAMQFFNEPSRRSGGGRRVIEYGMSRFVTAAMVMGMQFDAVAGHYYPDAEESCVLVRGEPSFWLHDMLTCPSRPS